MDKKRLFRIVQCLAILCLALVVGLFALQVPQNAHANSAGAFVYSPSSSNEGIGYSRVIRLQHSGSANGTLLATFEHWTTDGTPSDFLIERSTDNGQSWQSIATVQDGETGAGHPWSHMWQPSLFEFPQTIGSYPAGTLLLVGDVVNADASASHFESWRSTDSGAHWSYVSTFQTGGGAGNPQGSGIWEPNLQMDKNGNLVCYFSDEREASTYSQFIGHIVSTDGGNTWGPEVLDVASASQPDRPGMATVVALPNGTYIMSFELCDGSYVNCEVHVKTSADGENWRSGPSDLGTRVQTGDGRYVGHSPYLTWSPSGGPNGELILSSQREYYTNGNTTTPEDYRALMINTNLGAGNWSWMPAPFVPATSSPNCNTNYSPALSVSADGNSVLLMTLSSVGSSGPCEIRAGSANAGVIPYQAPFGSGTDAGWNTYNGIWSVSNGVYSEQSSSTNGDKSLTGSTGWTDYTLSGDMQLTSSANAGFLLRTTNPANGVDTQQGYFVGLDSNLGELFLGKENYSWTSLDSLTMPGGISLNIWYHFTIKVSGCTFTVSAQPTGGVQSSFTYTDSNCFPSGQVGVRNWNAGSAAWKNIAVSSNSSFSTSFESGQPQPTWTNTVDNAGQPAGGSNNVGGICCGLSGPEMGTRAEVAHSGSAALLYSGLDNSATSSYSYMEVFDLSGQSLTVGPNTTLTYWIYPESPSGGGPGANLTSGNDSSCVAIDLIFSDGTNLRDSGATDQHGNRIHPAYQCGHLTMDTWNQVVVNLGSFVNGKTILRLDVGYDQPTNTGGYRGYIDDISIA